ncbi:MAG: PHP domain-containing protein [Bacillota bacterium]|nr:PHP domain-containing protein [Bacillota bacterium]
MIDLHMHTRFSDDGEFTPESLVEQCHQAGVQIMAITDHNCAKANEIAALEAERRNIYYVPGIEVDCSFEGVDFHILGYGIDHKSPDFIRIEQDLKAQEMETSLMRLQKTRELGFDIHEDELRAKAEGSHWNETWTADMFAEILLSKEEYKDHPILLPYREGGARSVNPLLNFYWDLYSQGKPCYVQTNFPQVQDVIRIIHQNGGLAVLAHPDNNLNGREEMLDSLVSLGIDGLEAYSSYHTDQTAQTWAAAAKRHKLLITCGSDYHGKMKPAIKLMDYGSPPDLQKMAAVFIERLEAAKN